MCIPFVVWYTNHDGKLQGRVWKLHVLRNRKEVFIQYDLFEFLLWERHNNDTFVQYTQEIFASLNNIKQFSKMAWNVQHLGGAVVVKIN